MQLLVNMGSDIKPSRDEEKCKNCEGPAYADNHRPLVIGHFDGSGISSSGTQRKQRGPNDGKEGGI